MKQGGRVVKKAMILLSGVSLLFLVNCGGGGGSSPTADNSGSTPNNSGGTVADNYSGTTGNVTVYFPANVAAQRTLVDTTGMGANAGRVAVTQNGVTDYKCIHLVTTLKCDTQDPNQATDCWYVTACGDLVDTSYDDPNNPGQKWQVIDPVSDKTNTNYWEPQYGQVTVAVADTVLDSSTNSLTLNVPPGTGYTIHALEYISGTLDTSSDPHTFTATDPNAISTGNNGRIVMTGATRNLITQYGASDPTDIIAGDSVNVTINNWKSDLADIQLSDSTIVSGDSYQVTRVFNTTDALSDTDPWAVKVDSSLQASASERYIMENDADGTGSGDTISITPDILYGTPGGAAAGTPYTVYNVAQFYINPLLVAPGESNTNWVYGTALNQAVEGYATVTITP